MKNSAKNRGRLAAIKDIMEMCATTPRTLWPASINDIHGMWLYDLNALKGRVASGAYEEEPGDHRRGVKHYKAAVDLIEAVRKEITPPNNNNA